MAALLRTPVPSLLAKLALGGATVVVLGVPITRPLEVATLFVALVVAGVGQLRPVDARVCVGLIAMAVVIAARAWLPAPSIEETHAPFVIVDPARAPFGTVLPSDVHDRLSTDFETHYLSLGACDAGTAGCWRSLPQTPHATGFSADALWFRGSASRLVGAIDFDDLPGLRMSEVNSGYFDYYVSVAGNIDRAGLPFFVSYRLPASFAGARLCWRGLVFWPARDGHVPVDRPEGACRTVTDAEIGEPIIGARIGPASNLAMRLDRPIGLVLWEWGLRIAGIASVALALWSFVRPAPLARMAMYFVAAGATVMTITLMKPAFLIDLLVFRGGNDGLTHEAFAHEILRAVAIGDWRTALIGGEPIFYFMPGLRYVLALGKAIFGDTHWLTIFLLCLLPVVFHRLFRELLSRRTAPGLTACFLLVPIFERFGLAHFNYVRQAYDGNPEGIAYLFLALGLLLGVRALKHGGRSWPWGLAFGLTWFVAVAIRPNMLLPAAVMVGFVAWRDLRERNLGALIGTALGLALVLLIPLHNWVFGHQFVPLTAAAAIPQNLVVPPGRYADAFGSLLGGSVDRDAWRQIGAHLSTWQAPSDFYRYIALAGMFHAIWRFRRRPAMLAFTLAGVAQQALFLFYNPQNRYTYGAWMGTFLCFAVMAEQVYWPRARRFWIERIARPRAIEPA